MLGKEEVVVCGAESIIIIYDATVSVIALWKTFSPCLFPRLALKYINQHVRISAGHIEKLGRGPGKILHYYVILPMVE